MITIIVVMNTGEHAEDPHNGHDRAGETRLAVYYIYQFIIMPSPIYNHFAFGPIEDIRWSNRGNRGHDWTVL